MLTVGGDAVLGTREAWKERADAFPATLETQGIDWPFGGLQELFSTDDMTFINLECVLKETSAGERKTKLYRFRGLPAYAQCLTAGSVEQVNIANNHVIDYGQAGKTATIEALQAEGIPYSGYGELYVWEKDGVKIGFAGCRETTYKGDKQIIARETRQLRSLGCDVVIYTCHWGTEYAALHNELQQEMAQAAADAGVDIVIGGHPHVVQGIADVDGTVVLWSLGNLMFGGTIELDTFDAALARITLQFDGNGYVGCRVSYVPILTSSLAAQGTNDYHPVLAEGQDAERILAAIQADTAFPVTDEMSFTARGMW